MNNMIDALQKLPVWLTQPVLLLICWFGWMQSAGLDSRLKGGLGLALMTAAILLLNATVRLLVLRLLVASLFIIFSLDKMTDLESFAESIIEYQIVSESTAHLLAGPLAYAELIFASLFLIWSVLTLFDRFRVSPLSQSSAPLLLHVALLGMLITFCCAITYGILTNPYMDCGCGDSWNPIDVFSKTAWFIITEIKLPGLPASLFRNVLSVSVLIYSLRSSIRIK